MRDNFLGKYLTYPHKYDTILTYTLFSTFIVYEPPKISLEDSFCPNLLDGISLLCIRPSVIRRRWGEFWQLDGAVYGENHLSYLGRLDLQ